MLQTQNTSIVAAVTGRRRSSSEMQRAESQSCSVNHERRTVHPFIAEHVQNVVDQCDTGFTVSFDNSDQKGLLLEMEHSPCGAEQWGDFFLDLEPLGSAPSQGVEAGRPEGVPLLGNSTPGIECVFLLARTGAFGE